MQLWNADRRHDGAAVELLLVALTALGCAGGTETVQALKQPPPVPASSASAVARPEPRAVIEKAGEAPFIEDYLGARRASLAAYQVGPEPPRPIVPFQLGYREYDFHLIAYFDGHPTLEAVECMARLEPSRPDGRWAFAITTQHDNRQEYYVSDGDSELGRTVTMAVHRAPVVCEVADDWKSARIELTTAKGEALNLSFGSMTPPDPKWRRIVDPGRHNPTGGVVVMVVPASAIAVPPSGVTIGGERYPLVPHEASHPPWFIGFHSYLTRDFAYAFLNTHRSLPLAAVTPAGESRAFDAPSNLGGIEADLAPTASGIPEITAIRARETRGEHQRFSALRFNPPFPNLRAMAPGTEVKIRFDWTMPHVENPAVFGEVVVTRQAEGATVRVVPAYPGWAKEGRPVVCTIDLGVTPPTTTCKSTP